MSDENFQQTASFFHPNNSEVHIIKSPPQLLNKASHRPPLKPTGDHTKGSPPEQLKNKAVIQKQKVNPIIELDTKDNLKRASNSFTNLTKQAKFPNKPLGQEFANTPIFQDTKKQTSSSTKNIKDNRNPNVEHFEQFSFKSQAQESMLQKQFEISKHKFDIKIKNIKPKQVQNIEEKKNCQCDVTMSEIQPFDLRGQYSSEPDPRELLQKNRNFKLLQNLQQQSLQNSLQNSQIFLPKINAGIHKSNDHVIEIKLYLYLFFFQAEKVIPKSLLAPSPDTNQYGFPFRKGFELQNLDKMRKSKTAQETLREQQLRELQIKLSQQQESIIKKNEIHQEDSRITFPQINSPNNGTLTGFGQSKGKSFLLRKPQAKIVSRLFSSKSDNN